MTRTFVLVLLLAGMPCAQAVELPRMFSDGMVLQRDQPIPVWGNAAPGTTVSVTLAGRTVTTRAEGAAFKDSSNEAVSAKWPMWFVARCIS